MIPNPNADLDSLFGAASAMFAGFARIEADSVFLTPMH